VQDFLRRLHAGMGQTKPYILLKTRPENTQGLLKLRLNDVYDCIPYITALTPDHFSHVQQSDVPFEAAAKRHLWVFGVLVGNGKKRRPAYVKIQLGLTPSDAICISFHPPAAALTFPFPSAYSLLFESIYNA